MREQILPLRNDEKKFILLIAISIIILFATRLFSFPIQLNDSGFLLIHTLLQAFSIFVAISIFFQAWITFSPLKKNSYFFVGLLFFSIGIFDLIHTLSFEGMPFFNESLSATRATWFLVVTRLTEAMGLLLAIICSKKLFIKERRFGFIITAGFVSVVSAYIFFHTNKLPLLLDHAHELTPLRMFIEFIICTSLFVALIYLIVRYLKVRSIDMLRLISGIFLLLISELFFMVHTHAYDWDSFFAHIFKFFGYVYLYRAIFFPKIQLLLLELDEAIIKKREAEKKLFDMQKEFSQRIIQSHENEKKRVSRELHDSVGQSIYSILITLDLLDQELPKEKRQMVIKELKTMASNTMKEVREVAYSLRPSVLDDLGFLPALKTLISNFENTHRIPIRLTVSKYFIRLSSNTELALYRICQEALTNAAKYAKATHIAIELTIINDEIILRITDDGVGFDLKKVNKQGIGLYSMKERANVLGGTMDIISKIGEGTEIRVVIPIHIQQ